MCICVEVGESSLDPAEPAARDLVLCAGELATPEATGGNFSFLSCARPAQSPLLSGPARGGVGIRASVGAADEAWKSITIAAAAGVRGSLRLLMISADSRFFPNSSKKSLLLYVLAWFQEGSTAVKSTNELKAETSIML